MYDDFATHLGKAIKTFRISNKWTQQELAEKLDVSHNHMQSIENRRKVPSTMVLYKLHELGMSLDIVFNDDIPHMKKEILLMVQGCKEDELPVIRRMLLGYLSTE